MVVAAPQGTSVQGIASSKRRAKEIVQPNRRNHRGADQTHCARFEQEGASKKPITHRKCRPSIGEAEFGPSPTRARTR